MDFKKALQLYTTNSNKISREEIISTIDVIKTGMNTKRSNWVLPEEHEVRITREWLLGFVEGDGSFSFDPKIQSFIFVITQKNEASLMAAIKDFLFNLAPREAKDAINIPQRVNSNGSVINNLVIKRMGYINSVLIPLFDSLTWYTNKELDYLDWKAIFNLWTLGFHYTDEGKSLISSIVNQMNYNRLSTSDVTVDRNLLHSQVTKLLSGPSNLEIRDGKSFIISLNRNKAVNKSITVQIVDINNSDILGEYKSYADCAKTLGVPSATVLYRVKKGNAFTFNSKLVRIDRKSEEV